MTSLTSGQVADTTVDLQLSGANWESRVDTGITESLMDCEEDALMTNECKRTLGRSVH